LLSGYVDDLIAVGELDFFDLLHDKMGSLVGDGRVPGLCSVLSAINESKDIRETEFEAFIDIDEEVSKETSDDSPTDIDRNKDDPYASLKGKENSAPSSIEMKEEESVMIKF
jgi:hypothetical protein